MGLVEAVVAFGLATILVLVLCATVIFSSRSFAALYNYVDLDDVNRIAIDRITRDVRQANKVKSWTSNSLTLVDADNKEVVYTYNSFAETLTRAKQGSPPEVILTGCDQLQFTFGQRNTVGGTYDVYPPASPDTCKVINMSWMCSRKIFGRKENTESVQTARIVIRKQGT